MEEIRELIRQYGLEEDEEHVIIPLPGRNSVPRRCYILKRPHLRIVYEGGRYIDYPLSKIIEAIVRYPEMRLSEALYLLYEELELEVPQALNAEQGGLEESHEKENSD